MRSDRTVIPNDIVDDRTLRFAKTEISEVLTTVTRQVNNGLTEDHFSANTLIELESWLLASLKEKMNARGIDPAHMKYEVDSGYVELADKKLVVDNKLHLPPLIYQILLVQN